MSHEFQPPALVLNDCAGVALTAASRIVTDQLIDSSLPTVGAGIVTKAAGNCPATLLAPVCAPAIPLKLNLILGADAAGTPEWQRDEWGDADIAAAGTIDVNVNTNRIFFLTTAAGGNVTLTNPGAGCFRRDIWIKNIAAAAFTVTSAALIDGVGVITLDPTVAAGYPFGNNGGEAVHLHWSVSRATWFVI